MKSILFFAVLLLSAGIVHSQDLSTIDALFFDSQYDQVLTVIDAALKKTSDGNARAILQNKKAEALIRGGKFNDAEQQLKDISAQSQTAFQQAITQTNYGLLYLYQGRNDRSLEALQNALQNFEKDGKENSPEAAQAIAHLGNLYRSTGKYAQAEEQLTRALAIRQKFFKDNNEWIAASYNDLGLVYSATDPDKALTYYEKAQAIYETLHGKDHPKIALANTNTGFIYRQMELYGDAVNNFESALKTWEKIYAQPHPTKAFVLFSLGETYLKMGDKKAALGYYDRALAMYESAYGKKHPERASVWNAIGNLKLSEGNFNEALKDYQYALQANVRSFESDDLTVNPVLKDFYNGNTLLYSLLNKAQALESRYFGKTLKLPELELAVKTLQVADTLIDRLRQQITNETDKIALGAIANEIYANGVRMTHEIAQVALHKRPWRALSFYFAEKSKSAVLLEAISDVNAKSFAGIPAALLEEEKSLKAMIALTAQQLAQKPSEQEERYLRETAFNLNRSYENFTRQLETKFPEYFNLKYNTASPSIPELQARMDDHTAVLSYFTDDKNNHLYIFVVTKKHFSIVDHALPPSFDKYITGLRNSLYFNEINTYRRAAENLSALLIPDHLPHAVKDLVILPTGRLSIVPFETLLSGKVKREASFATLPYLLRQYSVRYEFSASLILQKSKTKSPAEASIFLCAPVVFDPKENLNELPGTESEVNEISQLFTTRHFRNAVYTRDKADEQLAKSDALKNFSYLHFATHGIVDEANPELSRIFLNATTNAEDGNLFTGEIYNLQLNANLVTLSACQTGLGKISQGEGVIGLSRALVYAGAKNIIVSFWSVADESTAELMKDFYGTMLENPGSTYSQNLRQAKLDLLKSERFKSPYYWAPFVLIGF
ncbi:CHAT domain-containing protein [Chryseolinea lacunae]|uniref:CHAT domain-containing protein n=1 Tax=Chryseolinea lacunae TaxID=2801331 RepID=A0ABS1KXK3_9BACT|nr:CHAT domain-containing protein [Chryseolinea lacunae]MBL0743952.1 CHAT domain-containing protein [Chryseolinea lacunae]